MEFIDKVTKANRIYKILANIRKEKNETLVMGDTFHKQNDKC